MADLGGVFDSSTVAPMADRTPIPAGDYRVTCVKSDWKDTQKGGKYLEFTWQVLEGPYTGRMVWSRLNLRNANSVAVKIAESELKAICDATGIKKLRDSVEVHNIPIVVSIAVEPASGSYGPSNSIEAYKSVKQASEVIAPIPVGAGVTSEAKPSWM